MSINVSTSGVDRSHVNCGRVKGLGSRGEKRQERRVKDG